MVSHDSLLKLEDQSKLQPTDKVLLGPCKYKLNYKGTFTATLTNKSKSIKEHIYVVEDLTQPLLRRAAAESLNLINRIHKLTSDEYKAKVIHDYPKLFTGLGMMKEEFTIKLKDDVTPFAITVQRKVPMPLYAETKYEIDRMLKSGVTSPVDSPKK